MAPLYKPLYKMSIFTLHRLQHDFQISFHILSYNTFHIICHKIDQIHILLFDFAGI